MEGYQWGEGRGEMREKAEGVRNINDRYKIDRGRLRTVYEALAGVAQWIEHRPGWIPSQGTWLGCGPVRGV